MNIYMEGLPCCKGGKLMNEERIINRVRKLLNMSKNATPNERENALLLSQRLMAKYHLDESVLGNDGEYESVVELTSDLNSRKVTWKMLAKVIAENFKCDTYTVGTKTYHKIIFVGYDTDAIVCKEVYESAYHFIVRYSQSVASYYQRRHGTSKGVRDEWAIGFIEGLNNGFKDQVTNSNEVALMIVVPEEVNEFMNSLDLISDDSNPMIKRNGNQDIYQSGYGNGYQFAQGKE